MSKLNTIFNILIVKTFAVEMRIKEMMFVGT